MAPVHDASWRGDLEELKRLVQEDRSLLTAPDELGGLPLHVASEKGHDALVEYLLDEGSPVNPFDRHSRTPLHLAARGRYAEIVRLLLKAGAAPNHSLCGSLTIMDAATSAGNNRTVINLLTVSSSLTALV